MLTKLSYIYLILFMGTILGCSEKWDEHNEIKDPNLKENLFQKISANENLSLFKEALVQTGYDTILKSSVNYTVWAPNNSAMGELSKSILQNAVALKAFVANHIAFNEYYTNNTGPFRQVKTLNGKNVIFTRLAVDEISIQSADDYSSNGVLHIINGRLEPKQNIYEFLLSFDGAQQQKEFVKSLGRKVFDPSNGVIIGIDPATGKPIYQQGTDSAIVNDYVNRTKINNEEKTYTYVILSDQAFQQEEQKFRAYFSVSTPDSTNLLTRSHIVKDLTFDGLYLPGTLPDSLTSIDADSVKIHIDPSSIISTKRVSNGIVYVVNKINYNFARKLGVVKLGESEWVENNIVVATSSRSSVTITRRDQDGITPFSQIRSLNLAKALTWYRFSPTLKKAKYRVYMRAVRDVDPAFTSPPVPFPQRIAFTTATATNLPYVNVTTKSIVEGAITRYVPNYDEVFVGEYTSSKYGQGNVFIVSNTVTTAGLNNIILDYIKLVPVSN